MLDHLSKAELDAFILEGQRLTGCPISVMDTPNGRMLIADYPDLIPRKPVDLGASKHVYKSIKQILAEYDVCIVTGRQT